MMAFRQGSGRTIRRFAVLLGPLLLLGMMQPASAQDSYPRVEVFGGASYIPESPMDYPRQNSAGFQTSVTININKWFGVVGDFGGQYSHASNLYSGENIPTFSLDTSVYQYMAGARFTKRTQRVNLFVHALFGSARGSHTRSGFADNKVAFGGGGGFDIHVSRRIAIRPLQLDFLGSLVDMLEQNIRVSAGVVIKLGSKN